MSSKTQLTTGQVLELLDLAGLEDRLRDVEGERDAYREIARAALTALEAATTQGRMLRARNRMLSDEIQLWRNRALGRSLPADGSEKRRRAA